MALVSPGVEVTVIDQSQYLPTASNSVPLLLVATATNKANAAGTGVATGTLKSNANKLYQVTSQRDLVTLFGNPFFYKTTTGTPIHGYELNEYGLLAAYSLLGSTNRCYILRADVDLAAFVGSVSRPSGQPANGTYWLDTTNTMWGIYEFNYQTGEFTEKTPIVIVDTTFTNNGKPLDSIGNIGDYAVIATNPMGSGNWEHNTYFFKTRFNTWETVGSREWKEALPAATGTVSNPTLTAGNTFSITPYIFQTNGTYTPIGPITITVPASPYNTVDGVVTAINDLSLKDFVAYNIKGKLAISYTRSNAIQPLNYFTFANVSGTPLTDLGINATTYFSPKLQFAPASQMPLWTAGQNTPHPTGSVWIKTSSAGDGVNLVLSSYDTTLGSYKSINVGLYQYDSVATGSLDSTGGKAIPKDTVYAQYGDPTSTPVRPIKLYKRLVTGPTVVTGTTTNPVLPSGVTVYVRISTPGVTPTQLTPLTLNYNFTTTGTTLDSFIENWTATQIPFTKIVKTTSGQVQISHVDGGEIYLSAKAPNGSGAESNILTLLGLIQDETVGVKAGPDWTYTGTNLNQTSTTGSGTGGVFSVGIINDEYVVTSVTGGTGYQVGDQIVIAGTQMGGLSPDNDLTVRVLTVNAGALSTVGVVSGNPVNYKITLLSNWVEFDYIANEGQPVITPEDGKYWYYSTPSEVDIMVNRNGVWKGYKNVAFDSTGHPLPSGTNTTDPAGPIVAASAPTTQSDGTSLVYGDLWIDSSDLENYPMIYRWQAVKNIPQWVLIDTTDQVSKNGIVFADARWAPNSYVDPVEDPIPTIVSLLSSDYVDLDAPNPTLYPQGMLLFNTRRSGYNVKEFMTDYFTGRNYPNAGAYNPSLPNNGKDLLPYVNYTWVSASGLKSNGSAYMGRKAQRNMVVQALKASIGTNQTIREEDNFFNLISCPGYTELQPDMVVLNNDRHNTAYIVGDTPLRLSDSATDITNWATNNALATSTGEDGLVTRDSYMGIFYPSGITTDLTGAAAVVPASHMMLRTLLRNDTIAYPWLAPAGTRRGTIDNATNIGYLDSASGEFQVIKNRMSIRDVLYTNQINPLAYFTGVGLLNYGNKNTYDSQSAMDRINVARLVAYIRERLNVAARPFVFEPNDALTRQQITAVVQSLFIDLVAKRGLYDYLVVCDASNNTPARIDRNELWIDIAIEPVKAAEFIYIPVRIMITGALGK